MRFISVSELSGSYKTTALGFEGPDSSTVKTNTFEPAIFEPASWLPGPHLQTLGARFLRPSGGVPLHRERVELDDGDFIDLDFAYGSERSEEGPMVLLLHGLEGSAKSKYALQTYRYLDDMGIASVGMNARSCSGELNRLARMYHSGETGDLDFILRMLNERFGGRVRGIVGFSLGGNALLKYLGESGDSISKLVDGAVAVSVPYDLSQGADYLDRPSARIYRGYLLGKLRKKVWAKRELMPSFVDAKIASTAENFRIFDDAVTSRLHGFSDADDYYRQSSCKQFLGGIRVPTLLIQAADDPFQPHTTMPHREVEENPFLVAAFSKAGGHVGFVGKSTPWQPLFWAEREAGRFMAHILNGKGE